MSTVKKRHPLSGHNMSGADMIVQVLADEGVDTVFGYNGGAILPTYDAVFRFNEAHAPEERVNLVIPANEQGAGFMAAGYARATGKVGVFIVTSGPGATNCVTPIRDAMADSVPIVLITGQVARPSIGTDAFQEAPMYNIMSACAKHVFLVSDDSKLEATVRTAFALARSGRPGPVVIDVPKDVQNHIGTYSGHARLELKGYDRRLKELQASRLSEAACEAFFKLLGKARKPLLYVGGGVINANAAGELRAFSKHFRIPVVTTLTGIGAVDTTDDLSLHMLGMHGTAYANYAVEDCDFLFAVGARFDDRVAGRPAEFAPHARIAHIDIDAAEIGKIKKADWSYVGDAKTALKDLLEAGKGFKRDGSSWLKHVAKLKHDHPLRFNTEADQIQPQEVIQTLNEVTKGDAIICTGVGQHQMWAAQYCEVRHPRGFISSASMGTMGYGLPSSIGAQIGCPDKVVIDIDGDGSLRMNIGEMDTAAAYNVPIKILLLNNRGDGMVLQWQRLFYSKRFSGTEKWHRKKNFVKAAEADGYEFAKSVSDRKDLKSTLAEFVKFRGPAFLEVITDQTADVFPMVGPGQGYKDMNTGPYIHPRPNPLPADIDPELSDSF